MESTLAPTLGDSFFVYFEENWLQNYPSDFKPRYCGWYFGNMLVLFTSPEHLGAFWNFLKGRHANMSFKIHYIYNVLS